MENTTGGGGKAKDFGGKGGEPWTIEVLSQIRTAYDYKTPRDLADATGVSEAKIFALEDTKNPGTMDETTASQLSSRLGLTKDFIYIAHNSAVVNFCLGAGMMPLAAARADMDNMIHQYRAAKADLTPQEVETLEATIADVMKNIDLLINVRHQNATNWPGTKLVETATDWRAAVTPAAYQQTTIGG